MLTVVAAVDVIVKLCVGGVTPGGVVNVSVDGVTVSTGCALAVSKQHTSVNMSVPSPNKVFLVVFKTPPLKQDVSISGKRRSYPGDRCNHPAIRLTYVRGCFVVFAPRQQCKYATYVTLTL